MELVIASNNLHKVHELREMTQTVPELIVVSLHQFPDFTLPPEKNFSFQKNAEAKALYAAKTLNKTVLADDSGLVIPVLGDTAGSFQRRYDNETKTDAERVTALLQLMEDKEELARTAYMECCLTLATPEKIQKTTSAKCEGFLAKQERGRNGFGYDSIFIKHDYDKTFAELEDSIRIRISHRRKAFDLLAANLEVVNCEL